MKLSTLILTTVITFSTATAAQAKPHQVRGLWGNVLQHKVRSHQRHQRHLNHRQHRVHHQRRINHRNRRRHRQLRHHRSIHRSAYPYYQRQVRH